MRGSVFAKTLPKEAGPRREQMLLDAVRRRDIPPIAWVSVVTKYKSPGGREYTATFKVSKDALRVGGADDSFRFSVNHRTAQHIADALDSVLPTPYLSDQIWKQSVLQLPSMSQTRGWFADGTMSKTYRMLEQSDRVDKLIAQYQAKTGTDGLIADVGKDWVTHPDLWRPYTPSPRCEKGHPRAMNYGWHAKGHSEFYASTVPGIRVIQPAVRCHTIPHVDYSQVVRLVRRDVDVCGVGHAGGCMKMDIRQLATSPQLHALVSASGQLEALRHPDVAPSCDKRCPPAVTPQPVEPEAPSPQCPSGEIMTGDGCKPFFPEGPCPEGQIMTQQGCKLIPTENSVLIKEPPEAGPLSCPTGCDELPETEPDPTWEYLQAEMSGPDKAVMLAAGGVLGFFAVKWLLPKL